MVTKMNRKIVDLKLDRLEQQRDLVLESLGEYINKVIAGGRAWADDTSQNWSTFSQVLQVIDTASDFLDLKYIEIKDVSDGVMFLEPSVPQETQDSTQQTISSHFLPNKGSHSTGLANCHSA
ncbi:unnamed protein product, partial [Candidula unifasciata]